MCGRYELKVKFNKLPALLKKEMPKGFEDNYQYQESIKPNDPVIVLKNEGRTNTSIMLWGYIPEWSKDPFSGRRPFNARAETVRTRKIFKESWTHKRCLLPASAFHEKGHRFSKIDFQPFWLGGIWNKWSSTDGSELESCCILTTEPNELLRPIHNRMPVIIAEGKEELWLEQNKNIDELNALEPFLKHWNPQAWKVESLNINPNFPNLQLNLF